MSKETEILCPSNRREKQMAKKRSSKSDTTWRERRGPSRGTAKRREEIKTIREKLKDATPSERGELMQKWTSLIVED